MTEVIIVKEQKNKVIVSSVGVQGPRGNSILNGNGAPANNLGIQNDFYVDNETKTFYGPKLFDSTWDGANSFILDSGLANQLDNYALLSDIGAANGIASLNSSGKIPFNQIPALGLAGNNDLTVTGIENPTRIDSFSKTEFGTLRYVVQVKKGNQIVSSAIDVVNDQTNLYWQEVEVSSNTTSTLATLSLEENAGIIDLVVTPTNGEVSVRFYRTALKI